MVEVPAAALPEALNVNVLAVVAVAGLNAAVTPAGRTPTVKATLPANPPTGAIEIALVPVPPGETLAFVAEIEKSGVAG
jgi:hypothetical protein